MAASNGEAIFGAIHAKLVAITNPVFLKVWRVKPNMPLARLTFPCAFVWFDEADGNVGRADNNKRWVFTIHIAGAVGVSEDGDLTASIDEVRQAIEDKFDGDLKYGGVCEQYNWR